MAMYVGNLEPYQGIDLLLEGFATRSPGCPQAKLVIVGGRDADDRALSRPAPSGSGIDGLGRLRRASTPRHRCRGLLRQADVLVSPRLKGLNTPMKIYSYLDSGSAVLATSASHPYPGAR